MEKQVLGCKRETINKWDSWLLGRVCSPEGALCVLCVLLLSVLPCWLWDFCWGWQCCDTLQHCVPSEATWVCDGCDALRRSCWMAQGSISASGVYRAAGWLVGWFFPGWCCCVLTFSTNVWLVHNTSVLHEIQSQNCCVRVEVSGESCVELWGNLVPFKS